MADLIKVKGESVAFWFCFCFLEVVGIKSRALSALDKHATLSCTPNSVMGYFQKL